MPMKPLLQMKGRPRHRRAPDEPDEISPFQSTKLHPLSPRANSTA